MKTLHSSNKPKTYRYSSNCWSWRAALELGLVQEPRRYPRRDCRAGADHRRPLRELDGRWCLERWRSPQCLRCWMVVRPGMDLSPGSRLSARKASTGRNFDLIYLKSAEISKKCSSNSTLYWFIAASSSANICCFNPSSIPLLGCSNLVDEAIVPNAELVEDRAETPLFTFLWLLFESSSVNFRKIFEVFGWFCVWVWWGILNVWFVEFVI